MLRGRALAARRLACHAGVGCGWVGGLGMRLGARMGLCVATSREDLGIVRRVWPLCGGLCGRGWGNGGFLPLKITIIALIHEL